MVAKLAKSSKIFSKYKATHTYTEPSASELCIQLLLLAAGDIIEEEAKEHTELNNWQSIEFLVDTESAVSRWRSP